MISSIRIRLTSPDVLPTRSLVGVLLLITVLLLLEGPFQIFLAIVAAFALFTLTLRDLSIGVLALLASVPLQKSIEISSGGRELTATKLVVLVVAVAWSVRIFTGASRPSFDGVALALAAYVLVLALSIIEAVNLGAWAEETYRWAVVLMAYVAAREALITEKHVNRVILVMSCCVVAMSAVGLWQVVTGAGPDTFHVGGVTRAYGTFGEPNPFAGYLEMSIPLLIAFAVGVLKSGGRERRSAFDSTSLLNLSVFAVCIGSVTLALTQSRGGYLGFAAAVAVIVWLTGGKVRWLGTVGAGIGLAAVLISPYGSRISDRFGNDALGSGSAQVTTENFAARERSAHWRAAINMAKSSPILGIGAGNFNDRFREMTTVWRFRIPRGHAHNAYLQALAQAGFLGLVTYLSILLVVAVTMWRSYVRASTYLQRSIAIGVAAVTIAVAIHNMVDYLHVLSLGIQLAVVWAIVDCARRTGVGSPRVAPAS